MSKKKDKNYIKIDKYEKKIFGINKIYYIIKINHKYSCKNKLKIDSKYKLFKNYLYKKSGIKKYITKNVKLSIKINKDKNIMKNLKDIIDNKLKYNYCLTKNTLILSSSSSFSNNLLAKHSILCDKNPYASGEMIFHKNYLIFNNNSGTYNPTLKDIKILKKALPFLKIKMIDMNSDLNKKYFIKK